MFWRKWFVRLVVFAIVGGCAGGLLVYQRFTTPSAIREQVLAKLRSQLAGTVVALDSAQLRFMGGISIHDLRLARKDDPDKSEILHVPTAVLYHDKEKILEGELTFRKVVLERPHVRIQRRHDGTWSWQGVGGQLPPHAPLPIVVVRQGTLVLEDHAEHGTGKSIELSEVELRIVNDPPDQITIEGSATSDIAGRVRVQGQCNRQTREFNLTLRAERIQLGAALVDGLEKLCPLGALDGLKLEGTADFKADIAYHPASVSPFTYDIAVNLTGAKLDHPKLPLPLQEVEAALRCSGGEVRVEKLHARSGPTEIEGHGSALWPAVHENFECHLEARHLEMSERLFAPWTEKIANLYPLFHPTGLTTFRAKVAKRDGAWVSLRAHAGAAAASPSTLQLIPEDLGITFAKFPYPLERLTGNLDMNLLTKLVQVKATGYSGDRPVLISGYWQGERQQADGAFDIYAEDIPLDAKLVNALVLPNFRILAQSFNATGRGDIKAHIRHLPGSDEFQNEYHVRFHHAAIRWDSFPYPLENVSGYLDIYPKGLWEFRDGRGTHQGCEVFVEGGSLNRMGEDGSPSPGTLLKIVGRDVALDDELHGALTPIKQMSKSWEVFRPRGRLSFSARIDHRTLDPDDVEVDLEVRGGTIEPSFFPYALDDVSGAFHFRKNKLEIRNAGGRHQNARFSVSQGAVELPRGGGHFTDLSDLRADGLVVDDDLLNALPADGGKGAGGLRGAVRCLKLEGPIALRTRLIVAQGAEPGNHPDIGWEGQAWLKNATFVTGLTWSKVNGSVGMRGRYNGKSLAGLAGNVLLDEATLGGQPFRHLHAGLQVTEAAPDVLVVDLKAPVFGGDISGQARLEFNSTHRYEINLIGSQVDLGQFGQHNLGPGSKLQGAAMARLHLTGQGSDAASLDGNGTIDVPSGRLYNLPLILDVLKFIGLRAPASFDELHAGFAIHGQRVTVRRLEILGNAISLTGEGEFNLDGTNVALDFYPGWARVYQLLPPAVRPVPPAISKNLLIIEMRGKITANEKDRKFTMRPVPGIIDPLLHVRDRLAGPANNDGRDEPRFLPELGNRK